MVVTVTAERSGAGSGSPGRGGFIPRLLQAARAELARAFAVQPPGPLEQQDRELLERVARAVRRRRMQAPAVLFLESVKPLGFVGSQAMWFLRPFATAVLRRPADYDRFARLLERRDGIEALLERIEAGDADEGRDEGSAEGEVEP
ncbi:MAG: hypothetical protein KatS3mg102_2792 [Planctomycetota bacterium]|nr:MAG: hypothetical protein KatS3mg102_2792 [Planctomycetota bacterium]